MGTAPKSHYLALSLVCTWTGGTHLELGRADVHAASRSPHGRRVDGAKSRKEKIEVFSRTGIWIVLLGRHIRIVPRRQPAVPPVRNGVDGVDRTTKSSSSTLARLGG